jgi:hypothetical protein
MYYTKANARLSIDGRKSTERKTSLSEYIPSKEQSSGIKPAGS